jgi:hypothetical protein
MLEHVAAILGALLLLPGPSASDVPPLWGESLLSILEEDISREFGRERFLLRRRYGKNVAFEFGIASGPSFLLPVKAGREVPGLPTREQPTYGDLFSVGSHVNATAGYTFRPALSVLLRCGLERYPGNPVTEGFLGARRYDPFWVFPLCAGLRFGAPLSLPARHWWVQGVSPRIRGPAPFFEVLVGMAHRPAVERRPGGEYWRGATVFSGSVGLGFEVRFGTLSVSASASFHYHSEPPEGVWYAEAEAAMAVRVSVGFTLRF